MRTKLIQILRPLVAGVVRPVRAKATAGSIVPRQLLALHKPYCPLPWVALLLAFAFIASVADAADLISPLLPGLASVGGVSRSQDKLDIFTTDANGVIRTAAWQPSFTDGWHGWWGINSGQTAAGAPVTTVSRSADKLDSFVVGWDNRIYTAAWEPDFTDGWHGWFPIGNLQAPAGARVAAVSRSTDKLDIFVVGNDGQVWTAAWEPDFTDGWHGWWPVKGVSVPPGSHVSAVSRSTDKLDIFVTDKSGTIQTAAWEPDFTDGWHGWSGINGGQATAGAPVTAVSRSTDKLDVFVVGAGQLVYTAAWEPDFTGWHGWWPIGNLQAPTTAAVNAVSRSTDKLDIFVTDIDGTIQTAAWEPDFTAWHAWSGINGGQAAPGAPVTAISRSKDKLDVFVVGWDHRVYTAAWEPDFTNGWHGWFPIGTSPPPPDSLGPLQTGGITFSGGVPVGGSAQLSLWSDGSYVFEGSFHDSGFPSYNDTLVIVVKDVLTNTAYTFSHSGHMAGTVESGSRDDSWNVGSRSIELQKAWNNFASGSTWHWAAGANADFNSILDKALSAVGTVTGVISIF